MLENALRTGRKQIASLLHNRLAQRSANLSIKAAIHQNNSSHAKNSRLSTPTPQVRPPSDSKASLRFHNPLSSFRAMERLAATTRSSPPCGVVFTPRPCASKRPSNSRLYARSAKRVAHSESGAKLRSAVLGSFAGVALSFGVFVGGGHAEEVSMTSPFQGLQEMRERNQKKLDAAEESFQNSDILKELKAKSEANRSANKKAIENKYCFRQAEMGVGDCGGLRFIEGDKLKLIEGTTTGILFENPPEFLKQIFGNFFNDLKEIIAPVEEEDLEEEVAAFEAELAETVKAVEVIEAEIIAEPAKPVESEKPSPVAEPVKPAEPVEEKKESTEAPEPVKAPVKEAAEPEVSKEAAEPVKAADPVEEKKESTVAAEPVKSPEVVVEPEQPKKEAVEPEQSKKESVEPEKSTEAVEAKQSTEAAEPAKVTEVVEPVKSTEVAEPVQVAEVIEVSVKSAEPVAEPVEASVASEPAE
ncbi:hypothetical protein BSKO_13808 [Bryopsis sp. KO-2023]|nr:hypothetical protein BSKO_13808 [Bryopsis sp. KO-2023]